MNAPLSAEREITLDELVAHWGAQRASDVGQETLNRLEELQRARTTIEELRGEIKTLHQEHREERNRIVREAREDMADAAANARWDAIEEVGHGF